MARRSQRAPAAGRWWGEPATIAFALILALAAALRFWGLGRQSLWWDEAYSVVWSKQSFGWILDLMVHRDYHPPEYYFGLHVWMQAFGAGDVAVRAFSATLGLAGVAAAYLLGRDMFSRRVGLTFAILVCVSEFHLYYSQEARSYGLLFAASVLAMHAYWRFFHGDGDRRWRLAYYAVAAVLVLYAHYTGVFVLAAQFLHRGVTLALRPGRAEAKWWGASQAAIALLYLPWLFVLVQQAQRLEGGGLTWIPKPSFDFVGGPPDYSVVGTFYQFTGSPLRGWTLWLLVLNGLVPTALAGLNRERNPDDSDRHAPYPAEKVLLLVAWLLCSVFLPYLQSLVSQSIYLSRIVIPALAPFLLLAAVGLGRLRNPVVQVAAVALVVGLAVPGLVSFYGTDAKEQWREAAAFVEANAAPNATVVLTAYNAVNPWSLYAKRADLRLEPVGTDAGGVAFAANATASAKEVWLVVSHSGDPSALAGALAQGRHAVDTGHCQTPFAPPGLDEFPLAANPVAVCRFAV